MLVETETIAKDPLEAVLIQVQQTPLHSILSVPFSAGSFADQRLSTCVRPFAQDDGSVREGGRVVACGLRSYGA